MSVGYEEVNINALRTKLSEATKDRVKTLNKVSSLKARLVALNREEEKVTHQLIHTKKKTIRKQSLLQYQEAKSEFKEKNKMIGQIELEEQKMKNKEMKATIKSRVSSKRAEQQHRKSVEGKTRREQRKMNDEIKNYLKEEETYQKKIKADTLRTVSTDVADCKKKLSDMEKKNKLKQFLLSKINIEKEAIVNGDIVISGLLNEEKQVTNNIFKVQTLNEDCKLPINIYILSVCAIPKGV